MTSNNSFTTCGSGNGALRLRLASLRVDHSHARAEPTLIVTPIDGALHEAGNLGSSQRSRFREGRLQKAQSTAVKTRRCTSINSSDAESRSALLHAAPGPSCPLLLLGGSLLGGSLLGGSLLRRGLLFALLHCHGSFPRSKTYLRKPDRHESTGPCANSYQIFQLLEDELEEISSIFQRKRLRRTRKNKSSYYTI